MTPDQRFALLMALLTAALAGVGWLIRMMARAIVKWTQTEDKLSEVAGDISALVAHKDADHALIRADVEQRQKRADQEHGEIKERLTRLEQAELDRYRQLARGS